MGGSHRASVQELVGDGKTTDGRYVVHSDGELCFAAYDGWLEWVVCFAVLVEWSSNSAADRLLGNAFVERRLLFGYLSV